MNRKGTQRTHTCLPYFFIVLIENAINFQAFISTIPYKIQLNATAADDRRKLLDIKQAALSGVDVIH